MQLTRNSQNGLQKVRSKWLNHLQIYRAEGSNDALMKKGLKLLPLRRRGTRGRSNDALMKKGLKHTPLPLAHQQEFERRPDEEGIETENFYLLYSIHCSNDALMKKGLKQL